METSDREFAREHHVHYEVEPEEVASGDAREVVGFQIRLFAAHPAEKLETPASPRCVELEGELRSFAERVVCAGEPADRAAVVPDATPALYQSAEVKGADEVKLTVRVRCDSPRRGRAESEERCLGDIRRRLEAAGVPKR